MSIVDLVGLEVAAAVDRDHLLARRGAEMSLAQGEEYSLEHCRVHLQGVRLRGSHLEVLLYAAGTVSRGTFRLITGALPDHHLRHLHFRRHVMSVARTVTFAVIARDSEVQEVHAKVGQHSLPEPLRAPEH